MSELSVADDYLYMKDLRAPAADVTLPALSSGEPADQDAVYTRVAAEFGPPLARLAAAYEADRSRQQDLLQDLHFAVWRSLATFRNQCSLKTWVYRVAHNTATTYVRKQRRSAQIGAATLEELDDVTADSNVEHLVNDAVVLGQVMELIQRLKPLDRDVLLLYLEGLQAAEISDVVGISAANVAQKVHRARTYLKRHFHNRERS